MNENENNFESLRRLLALKRHETPPPGYFANFSAAVTARIRAGDARRTASVPDRLADELPWLFRLMSAFEAKPAFAGAFASALCLLLLIGIVYAERPVGCRAATNPASHAGHQSTGRGHTRQLEFAAGGANGFSFQHKPGFQFPAGGRMVRFTRANGAAGQFHAAGKLIPFALKTRCALETPPRFSFNQPKCQPKSSRSPTKKAAWARPPPPSTLPPASPPSASGCCSSTSTRRPMPPAASAWKKSRVRARIEFCLAKAAC